MSFILDALRKSEQERQRNQTPGIASARAQDKPRPQTFWLPLVMVLVGVNLSLLFFLWIKGTPETGSSEPVAEAVQQPGSALPATASPSAQNTVQRDLATQLAPAPPATPPAQLPATPSTPIPANPFEAATPPAAPAPEAPRNTGPRLPTMTELLLAGTLNVKPLHLDIHVYSEKPAERFVFINMHKYREGDTLEEGPSVREINGEGVVLTHQGSDFMVTREQ